jgi:hypothetical protein
MLAADVLGPEVDLIVINAPIVTILVALVIPLINGVITRWTLATFWKSMITLALNAISAFITASIVDNGDVVFSRPTLYTWLLGSAISFATYARIYKPLNVTSSTPTGRLAPNSGIGPSPARHARAT